MKTSSNSRPYHGLCKLLLYISALWAVPALANPISVSDLSLLRDEEGSNDIPIPAGDRIEFSADAAPNGNAGTTVTAQTTNLSTGLLTSIVIPFVPSTALPNEFVTKIPYDSNLTGPWTVTFTNDVITANTTTLITNSIEGVAPAPFANSVSESGSSVNPTFTWSYPTSVDGVTVLIYDKSQLINGVADLVFLQHLPGTINSYTLPTVLDGGYTLTPGNSYVVDLKGQILINPSGPVLNSNTATQSQAYFDFTPTSAGILPQLYLPSIDSNGVYNFNLTVQSNTTTYDIDPTVATGFIYTIGAGNPNFRTVVLPNLQGSEPYTITWDNGLHTEQIVGGEILNFLQTDPLGVSTFTVRGIDPADGLDPASGTEFVTGLTFVSGGSFTGTMTPITTGPDVYITNAGSETVSVINPPSDTVVATVKVGPNPVDAVLTPNGAFAYITNAGADTVSVINTATNSLAATVRAGSHPVDAAVTPDGSSIYVTNAGSNSVSVISTATNTVVATIPVGGDFPAHIGWTFFDHWLRSDPVHVAITPDGTRAFVTNAGSDNVSVINTTTHAVTAMVKVGRNPLDVAITPDSSKAYVTNADSNSVSVINNGTNTVIATVIATVPVGSHPLNVAIAPKGAIAYITNAGANSVTVINTATNAVVTTVGVGSHPVDAAVTPDGSSIYVTNAGSNSVSVISTATNTVAATVAVGAIPVDVSISPDGVYAYVTNAGSNSVSVIDTSTNAVSATVPVGALPVNAAIF